MGSSCVFLCSLEHTSLKDGKDNLLQLILWVVAHWSRLNGHDLVLRLTLLPGATSCGRRRLLSLLLPKELLKRFEFGLFLSYAERMHISICQTWMRCAWGEKVRFLSKHQLFTSDKSFSHTGHEAHGIPFLHTWKQILNEGVKKALEHDHRVKSTRKLPLTWNESFSTGLSFPWLLNLFFFKIYIPPSQTDLFIFIPWPCHRAYRILVSQPGIEPGPSVLAVWSLKHWINSVCELLSCVQSLQPHGLQPTRLPCPWNSPGKDAGVGCHFILQKDQHVVVV